jgi:hypothetical protein
LGGLFEVLLIYAVLISADLRSEQFITFVKVYILSSVIPLCFSFWQLANNLYEFSSVELPFQSLLIENKYEVLEHRYFFAGDGFSRISSTYAEPVLFSNYLCSVFLFSFVLSPRTFFERIGMFLFRTCLLIIMLLSISKLAILSVLVGSLLISVFSRRLGSTWTYVGICFLAFVPAVIYFDLSTIFERLFTESGHFELFSEVISELPQKNYVFGEGIDSIAGGSTHRFLLSRIYEAGVVGLIFAIAMTLRPFALFSLKFWNPADSDLKAISISVALTIMLGLHLYDFFIHLFPWICLGAIMSFYCSERRGQVRSRNSDFQQSGFSASKIA